MRILIVGAGAVGGYFGGRLAQAGRDVTFLVRPSRAKQLRQAGLCIISPHGDAVVTPKLVSAGEIEAHYNLVFLSVKAYALESAMDDLAPAVGPETMILPVLNGMRHLDVLAQRFGEDKVIGGVCLVTAEVVNGHYASDVGEMGATRHLAVSLPIGESLDIGDLDDRLSLGGASAFAYENYGSLARKFSSDSRPLNSLTTWQRELTALGMCSRKCLWPLTRPRYPYAPKACIRRCIAQS
jgi:ketopantoate reductase